MIVFTHPTGNANVRAALMGLYNAGILQSFNTCIASFSGNSLDRLSKIGPFSEFRRREFNKELQPYTEMYPWRELGRMVAGRAGFSSLTRHEEGFFSVDSVYNDLDLHVSRKLKKIIAGGRIGIYCYEDGAFSSFRAAKSLGIPCLYDLPIGYWREAKVLMEIEKEKWPEWAPTLTGIKNSERKLERKDEELKLADRIFVASRFTANTLKNYPGKLAPVDVIPYGFPPVSASREYVSGPLKRPLKLLFVGGLSQRKGIANLFEAVKPLKEHVHLTLVGRKSSNECPALDMALKQHTWIPSLSHPEVLKLMRENDVLVFPSLFEGFGLVITEAMSQGTPVITTERTAGPDLISHNENGWLVNAGSTEDLRNAIEELLLNPEMIAKTGRAAMFTASKRPWSVYGTELASAIEEDQNE